MFWSSANEARRWAGMREDVPTSALSGQGMGRKSKLITDASPSAARHAALCGSCWRPRAAHCGVLSRF